MKIIYIILGVILILLGILLKPAYLNYQIGISSIGIVLCFGGLALVIIDEIKNKK